MKLRRAIAVAAATAALAPIALMSAPAAFATDGEASPSASASQSADDTGSDTGDDTASTSPSPSTSTSTSPSPSASTSTSASPSASPSAPEIDYCEALDESEDGDAEANLSESLTSGLYGLPETVVAGSGWTDFTFKVANKGDKTIKNIKPLLGVAAFDEDLNDQSTNITLQILQKSSGTWKTLADASGDGATLSAINLDGGQSTSYSLRLSVSGKTPHSIGLTGGFATYSDANSCWIADDPNAWVYFFEILPAGSDKGTPSDAKPQTGGSKPVQISDVEVSGSLAETGSSSALPMIGLVGGAAVVAGAGAVFVVRRRKADGAHA